MKDIISNCKGFKWNEGNSNKNWHLHRVTDGECEDIFFNLPLIVAADAKHSNREKRFYALGRTENNRWLFVAFTIRENLIRVISARDMTGREQRKYAEKIKRYSDF
ncbi:MAG TPA: BrnT family toxin [Pyrinomonadaceae bacterium]|nr:BrnT family toxin [Pyrinomonadaceae bacterium]